MALLTPDTAPAFITRLKDLCEAIRLFLVPVVARLAGWCLGGGLEAALARDLRLGRTDSECDMPEVKVGIPSVIHAAMSPRRVGMAAATWLLLTGLGPQVLRQQKRLLRDWERLPLNGALTASVVEFARAFTTGEPQRHMQAFLDRRR